MSQHILLANQEGAILFRSDQGKFAFPGFWTAQPTENREYYDQYNHAHPE
jgi:hypothetical protein